jgi:aspartate aminotransferase/aminotransferase
VDASGIRKVFDLGATLSDPINLSIGQPDFDVPDPIKQAAIDAILSGKNGYTVTQGIEPLRERIAHNIRDRFPESDPGVLVLSGVSSGILLALMACIDPGDEVIVIDPYFVMYTHLVNLIGGRPVIVSSYPSFRLPLEAIEAAITPQTKMLLLNSPSNPTGHVYEESELQAAAELARRRDFLVISDEIYSALSYDGNCPSIVPSCPERTVLLDGFSKQYGMTGWRLGFAAGPRRVIEEMTKLQQYTFVCAPSMAQYAGLAALETDVSDKVDIYRGKRDLIYSLLAEAFEVERPGGAFYIFPRAPSSFPSASAFVEEAIRRNVLIIPGSVFSDQDTHFRLSYAADDEVIRRGAEILRKLARQ